MTDTSVIAQLVSPLPPVHQEELQHIGSGLRFIESPTDYLQELRASYGDTFIVDVFGYPLLMTFSAKGLEALYRFEEEQASFHAATFDMIRFKTPIEILIHVDARLFYRLLQHKHMPGYLQTMNRVVDLELNRWGDSREIDIFDAIRTLEQRVGYGLWIGEAAAAQGRWQALKLHFDVLDQESAFVDPAKTLETIKTHKAKEKAAARALYELIPELLAEHDAHPHRNYSGADILREHFAGEDDFETKVLNNVINANQGFLSNLYAAVAWVCVHLAQDSELQAAVIDEITATRARHGAGFLQCTEALNSMTLLEQVTMESVRLAQRSLTLRKVMAPLEFDDGEQTYAVRPGIYITSMLSVTNTQTPQLAQFNPDHYVGNKLAANVQPAGKETISTFGHGKHACPAQRFSLHMAKVVITQLVSRFSVSTCYTGSAQPSVRQMGGVSRPQEPARLRLTRR
ncbi:MAG: cytochrome P450 [Gammaproteobacteria bacterium]|nr:cytochrome P450 [Gammaproteobacteria bacterium]